MATKCERGAYYDEGGICGCGAGHADPDMIAAERAAESRAAEERARLSRPLPPEPPPALCTFCGKPFTMVYDHARCAVASTSGQPN